MPYLRRRVCSVKLVLVRIELGPVPASSARAWIDNGRSVLAGVRRAGPRLPVELPEDVGKAFDDYLDQWEDVARRDEVFTWSADIDDEHVRHLVVYWFGLMSLDDDVWAEFGLPFAPPEAEAFYLDLSSAVTGALADADTEVGSMIKASWPADTSIPVRPEPTVAPLRLVIVDDTDDVRLMLDIACSLDPRFEVVGEAENGAVAVEVCAEVRPDVIILDVMMPVMDGLTALPLIRAACPTARIVVASADDDPTTVHRATDAGADAFTTKGRSLDDLLDLLAP